MDTLKDTIIKQILQDGLDNSISYAEYRDLVLTKVENNSNTGHEVNEALANYTMLNNKRMKRWDKTIKIGEGVADAIKHKTFNQTWIIITESWCGDAAHVMPVINKIAELNDGINFRVVLRDDIHHEHAIFKTTTKDVIATYGPRPSTATLLVNDYKAKYGKLTPEFKEDLQQWYNKDKGHTVIADLVALIG